MFDGTMLGLLALVNRLSLLKPIRSIHNQSTPKMRWPLEAKNLILTVSGYIIICVTNSYNKHVRVLLRQRKELGY